MSRKVIVNGESICYLPPVDASEISFESEGLLSDNVQDAIEEINLKQGGDINGHLFIDNHDGTTSTAGESVLLVGNNIAEGTDGNSRGRIRLFANTSNNLDIMPPQDMAVSRQVWFPVPSDNNQTLALRSDLGVCDLLLDEKSIPTTPASYNCNWNLYYFIIINATFYGNICENLIVPTSYFNTTADGKRPMLNNTAYNKNYSVWKNGYDKVYIVTDSTSDAYGVSIYGIMKK